MNNISRDISVLGKFEDSIWYTHTCSCGCGEQITIEVSSPNDIELVQIEFSVTVEAYNREGKLFFGMQFLSEIWWRMCADTSAHADEGLLTCGKAGKTSALYCFQLAERLVVIETHCLLPDERADSGSGTDTAAMLSGHYSLLARCVLFCPYPSPLRIPHPCGYHPSSYSPSLLSSCRYQATA